MFQSHESLGKIPSNLTQNNAVLIFRGTKYKIQLEFQNQHLFREKYLTSLQIYFRKVNVNCHLDLSAFPSKYIMSLAEVISEHQCEHN